MPGAFAHGPDLKLPESAVGCVAAAAPKHMLGPRPARIT